MNSIAILQSTASHLTMAYGSSNKHWRPQTAHGSKRGINKTITHHDNSLKP